jgi:hypothetical protein
MDIKLPKLPSFKPYIPKKQPIPNNELVTLHAIELEENKSKEKSQRVLTKPASACPFKPTINLNNYADNKVYSDTFHNNSTNVGIIDI